MAGTTIQGVRCKVALGANKVIGIGTWNYTPGAYDELDDSEFEDTTEKIILGMRKRGSISFDGLGKLDADQQEILKGYAVNRNNITNIRLYMSSGIYLEPNQTTGYFNSSQSTGNATQLSYVNISPPTMSVDKNGLCKISFSAVVSGDMVRVG
jgi:hypothetical protein